MGTISNRDEWVYDFSKEILHRKVDFFIEQYSDDLQNKKSPSTEIKYTRDLKKRFQKADKIELKNEEFRICHYRCFVKQNLYYAKELNEMRYQTPLLFPNQRSINVLIAINLGAAKPFNVIASNTLVDLHFNGDAQCLPLYRYEGKENRIDNITDWGLNQFTKQYGKKGITKEAIFHYVYAVLHNPAYCKKYKLNLKREFPRIPFYKDFKQWSEWGKALMALHINYEIVEPYDLKQTEFVTDLKAGYSPETLSKPKLKADKAAGTIVLDDYTTLSNIPASAWEYKLGNRSALEWILDQYKESKPKDPTIAEKFNTYRFADYKAQVIDLLKRVCTVA